MKKTLLCSLFLSVWVALLAGGVLGVGITQETVTVSVPSDWRPSEPYKAQFVVPEGSMAFSFTVWGANKSWGIADISGGAYREVYSSTGVEGTADTPTGDAESSERVDGGHPGNEAVDPLSSLTLGSGTYVIWTEGGPGSVVRLQYLIQTR
jgi:hypothetical protein